MRCCHAKLRSIGVLRMIDEKRDDEKIMGVPVGDPRFGDVDDIAALESHWPREIENFCVTSMLPEEKDTALRGWDGAAAAQWVITVAGEGHDSNGYLGRHEQ